MQLNCIGIDLTPLLPGAVNGGAKIVVLELIRQLAKLAPDVNIVLLTGQSTHAELAAFESGNVSRRLVAPGPAQYAQAPLRRRRTIRRTPWKFDWTLFPFRKFLALFDRHEAALQNYDLLFFPFALSDPNRRLPLGRCPIPTVGTVYDLQHLTFPEFFSPHELAERQRCLEFHKRHSSCIVISNSVRDGMIAQAAASPESVVTVYIRFDARLLSVEADWALHCLQKFGLQKQRYFIYPANFWRHKNHETLLQAFALARSRLLPSDFRLVCTGAVDERTAEVRAFARSCGLMGSVIFPGFVSDREFAALMQSSAALVFPSLYEGFGMPVIEAMAAGCPVACSDCTSLPEVAGDAALLFDPHKPQAIAEAMCRLATDPSLRSELIAKGLRQAANFSGIERMAREYWAVFEQAARRFADRSPS